MNTTIGMVGNICAYQEKSKHHEDEEPFVIFSSYAVIDPLQGKMNTAYYYKITKHIRL